MIADNELIVDNFGGGGATTGIEEALGRHCDIAINHDPEALAMHAVNHPKTLHLCEDVWAVDIKKVVAGRRVGLAWFSPDCKHFSKAKGGRPVEKKIRGLAWVALRWAGLVRPRVIIIENVEEFQTWGPVLADGKPCQRRKGMTFKRWVTQLKNLGYRVDWKELKACDYGAPTSRNRLFIVARCDSQPIKWPRHTHGGNLKPYRTAAECIDWSLPCPSIFLTPEEARVLGVRRPLADATMRRIAKGIVVS
jgi:DNA (cytosine-5)-methyltransferase 1